MIDIFDTIIIKDIALEINEGGTRSERYRRCDPDLDLLRLYRERGGILITLGSDAHEPKYVGIGVDTAAQIAREAGFTEAVVYEKRVAKHFISL